ncbi:AAA family ATPase [Hydrogenimonas thermophila]|uniref:ORC1/DEAH AAA+ ATPase domain-containing protein n=1 Tax=Hydrogenimonas thermophila TaxID=223786 RepID=A0A1I5RS77_9BACT|nr:AAA family ATPase [Hydrogenimonas thermophila]SFP61429.1 hypothetical protein SAMN05216234_12839 [Hydrogenimonas thermophila]
MNLRDEFKGFLEANGLKQAHVARSIGVSAGLISAWLKGAYKGDNESLEAKVNDFMRNYSIKSETKKEDEQIVMLSNMLKAHFVMDEAVVMNEMAVLYGKAGSGKSTAVKEWLKNHPEAVFVEVVPGMSVVRFLKLVAEKLGIEGSNKTDELVIECAKEFKRRDSVLVVDEAEHLTINALEAVRRIYDFSKVPVILVGTYGLIRNLKGNRGELLQLYSRISGKWEFRELGEEDFEKLFGEHSKRVKKYTTHLRRAVNLYRKAKRFAQIAKESLNAKHIDTASSMIFLD